MKYQVFDPDNTPIAGTMLLEASAGTGKTYALERIVARLIGRKSNPLRINQILVVTFTTRAAHEMKERIWKILDRCSMENDRDIAERNRYRSALSDFGKAAIYTIHSFCRMVLTSWPFESSAPFQQSLIPGEELEMEEARSWMASHDAATLDSGLFKAVYSQAGSGEYIIKKAVELLLDEGIPPGSTRLPTPDEIESFHTFLKDSKDSGGHLAVAADHLFSHSWSKEAIKALFKASGGPNKQASSLDKIVTHMAACRDIHEIPALTDGMFGDPAETGIGKHFTELLFASRCIADTESLEPESRALLTALRSLIEPLEPFIEFRLDSKSRKVINLVERYMRCVFYDHAQNVLTHRVEDRKNEAGIWGYSDLIRRVNDAVQDQQAPLKYLLRAQFNVALIDEFQDTDPRQWQMFRTIFHTSGHVLVLIGDPKQSIYGFRGTGLQGYYAARTSVQEKDRFCLDTNYRSRKNLVDGVNHLFNPVFQTHSDGGEPVGFLPVGSGHLQKKRLDWPDADKAIALLKAENENACAEGIIREIRAMLDPETGARWINKGNSGEPEISKLLASDIAVLVRAVRQEEDIVTRLSSFGVPAIRFRSRSVFAQPINKTLQGLLQAFETPRNQSLWRGVLLDEFFRLPPDLLLEFEEAGYLDQFAEKGMEWRERFMLGRSYEALESFFSFTAVLGKWAIEAGRQDVGDTLLRPWTRRVLSEPDGERQWQNWRQLCELIQQKQFEGLREIPSVIAWMRRSAADVHHELGTSAIRLETESPAVRVMTIHAAKGLEFPLVFLHGGFSTKTKRSSKAYRFDDNGTLVIDRICREENFNRHCAYAWEEDKRLWYVAFTRAIYKLWVPLPEGGGPVVQLDSFWDLATGLVSSGEQGLPLHETVEEKNASALREQLFTRIKNLVSVSDFIHLLKPETSEQSVLSKPKISLGSLAPLPSHYTGTRDPSTMSYTSLAHDIREAGESDNPRVENSPLPEDRGTVYGTFVHACLEECDFTLARNDDEYIWQDHLETETLFSELAGRYYPPDWYKSRAPALKTMVRRALRSPIPTLGRLCDLEETDYRSEVEFQIYVPENSQVQVGDSEIRIDQGFLKGFIDLLVHKDGLWWVVDWKTNILPAGQDEKEIMDRSSYHFQYELYLLSLCRTLAGKRKRPIVWEKEIGGAVYLFLRKLTEHNDAGICMNKPSLERMLSITESMGCLGVVE